MGITQIDPLVTSTTFSELIGAWVEGSWKNWIASNDALASPIVGFLQENLLPYTDWSTV